MLKCFRCGHEWHPRTPLAPKKCPVCQATNWNTARPEMVKCAKCSHEWRPRIDTPTQKCPGCKTKKWNATPAPAPAAPVENPILTLTIPDEPEPRTVTCPKCSHEWQSRTDAPKQCPRCKARLDVDVGTKAEKRAKYCAARALAAVGPLAEVHIPDHTPLVPLSWTVYDWTGEDVGSVHDDLIIREGLSDLDPEEHYPVISGGRDGADGRYIEPKLYGWIRRDAPFARRS